MRGIINTFTLLMISVLQVLPSRSIAINENPCGQLYLTQSPNKRKNLQLNWNFTCDYPPDTIFLTLGDIKTNESARILRRIFPGAVSKGYYETNVSFKDVKFPGNWSEENENPDLQAQCFDYYVASVRDNKLIYSQCLSIHPAWMSSFGNLRISNMMIPGTHNSGAYQGGPPLIKNHVLNQDKSFWEQLVYGIRYFDIRIGRYGTPPGGLYINHAIIKCTALLPELQSVANFLKKSPKEVIILNFHKFPHPQNFLLEYHLEIVDTIKSVFGDMLYPYYTVTHGQGPELQEFWRKGKRVIVCYRGFKLKEENWLWGDTTREWGNVQKLEDLKSYIKLAMLVPIRGNPMKVLMAELTPTYSSILKHVTRTLKDLAVMVNRELSDWVLEDNRTNNVNIIATDFFTGNDMINVAIATNFKKLNRNFKPDENFVIYRKSWL